MSHKGIASNWRPCKKKGKAFYAYRMHARRLRKAKNAAQYARRA